MNSKRILLLLFFSGLGLISVAQMQFVDGYIVTNNHKKVHCQVRNRGSSDSSADFEYRLNDGSERKKIELSKVEEFGVENNLKYVRALIKVDVSPDRIAHLKDTVNSPEWSEGHAYLKTLVEGELATLYSYFYEGKKVFFFRSGNSATEPLFFKEYRLEAIPGSQERILTNNAYKEQLKEYLGCAGDEEIKKTTYTERSLIQYFVNFHICKNSDFHLFNTFQTNKGSFRLKIGTSLNRFGMVAQDYDDASKITFAPAISLGVGAEAEYLLPFNNHRFGLFAESNLYSYKSTYSDNAFNLSHEGYIVDYKTIEFPVGANFYINLGPFNRLYLRGGVVPHLILAESSITFHSDLHYSFSPSMRMMYGIGYNFRKLGVEFRYYSGQNITQDIYKRGSELSQVSFRIYYTLFETK